MKPLNFLKIVTLFIFLVHFSSCSKSNEESGAKVTVETEKISNTDYTETDEDLFTVDYKEFYDELAPHGQWIEVTGEDIGVNINVGITSENSDQRKITFDKLFGVNSAYASNVTGSFFVWKPSLDLNVGLTSDGITTTTTETISEPKIYVPYTNGQWINSDAGWYFKAPTPYEETTSHYGRWVKSPAVGWVWMPGRVWSPAWVDWRENVNDIAWAPLPPSTYIINNEIKTPAIAVDNYVIVEKKYFVEPEIYKYMYKENKNKIMIKEMRRQDGIMVKNKVIINKGPDPVVIQQIINRTIVPVKIEWVNSNNEVKYASEKYVVYYPQFIKIKGNRKQKVAYFKPEKFVTYQDAENITYEEKVEGEGKENKSNIEKSDKDNEKKPKENSRENSNDNADKNDKKNNNGNKNDRNDNNDKNENGKNNGKDKHENKKSGNDNKEVEKNKKDNGNKNNQSNDNNKNKGNNKGNKK